MKRILFLVIFSTLNVLFGQTSIDSFAKTELINSYQKGNELLVEIRSIFQLLEKDERTSENANQVKILRDIYYTSSENIKESKELIDYMRLNRFPETGIDKMRVNTSKIIYNVNSILVGVINVAKEDNSKLSNFAKNKNLSKKLKQIHKNRTKHKKLYTIVLDESKNSSVNRSFKEVN